MNSLELFGRIQGTNERTCFVASNCLCFRRFPWWPAYRAVRKAKMIPLARRVSRFNVRAKMAAWVRRSVTPMALPMILAFVAIPALEAPAAHNLIRCRAPEPCIRVELDLR